MNSKLFSEINLFVYHLDFDTDGPRPRYFASLNIKDFATNYMKKPSLLLGLKASLLPP